MNRPCFLGPDWVMGHAQVGAIAGVRYGLKNGRGEYLCAPICEQVRRLAGAPAVRVTPHADCAAKFHSATWLADEIDFYLALDETFRIVRILDARWN